MPLSFLSYRKHRLLYDKSLRQGARCPVDIGFAPTEVKRRVRSSRRRRLPNGTARARRMRKAHSLLYVAESRWVMLFYLLQQNTTFVAYGEIECNNW